MAPSSAAVDDDTTIQNPQNPNPNPPPSLLHLSFNQDRGCFAVGTTDGFIIYKTDPFTETIRRSFSDGGGIGIVQMLYRCNIVALVGGGPNSKFATNKVMIWDDHLSGYIGELSFRSEVKSVCLRRDRIVAVLSHKIFVYNFADLKLLHQIETEANPKGLCEISQSGGLVLVCLGLQKGQVRVEHYALSRSKLIMAHDSSVACVALTNDGRLMATTSCKGTLIRLFNTLDCSLLRELRRGSERAEIYSLSFCSTSQWLAVSGDKGTVHVFSLKIDSECLGNSTGSLAAGKNNQTPAPPSRLSFIKGALPKYFSSEWSMAQFRVQEGLKHIVAFGHQKNTIIIICSDGRFYRCQFDPVIGGKMTQLEHHNFLHPELSF
ncbi:hypothetical protein BUALT_Bualt19G0063600 [Buddleja alternifolia]|uniref:WD repeat domain phosphoinositide-interacting protein 3 n=1 Tax=Buddleja alternifolia TaxID=168488 RepID=A0AAV6W055_9LAMI|nr:hypothetical protein BUALT_Bualt19G0063600 [Buddleja alternifolia]